MYIGIKIQKRLVRAGELSIIKSAFMAKGKSVPPYILAERKAVVARLEAELGSILTLIKDADLFQPEPSAEVHPASLEKLEISNASAGAD